MAKKRISKTELDRIGMTFDEYILWIEKRKPSCAINQRTRTDLTADEIAAGEIC